ncbi:hypothetical protein WJX73_004875 [Symbiochloris irregularis]|uniref:Uncharacterized protein n=1 Tax=Symbiochloris irregularis TaxID=706552 RepID=A0AAW1PFK8_9CHLO
MSTGPRPVCSIWAAHWVAVLCPDRRTNGKAGLHIQEQAGRQDLLIVLDKSWSLAFLCWDSKFNRFLSVGTVQTVADTLQHQKKAVSCHEAPAWWKPHLAAESHGRAWAVSTSPESLEIYAGSSMSQPIAWNDEGISSPRSLHSFCFLEMQPSDPDNALHLAVLFMMAVNEGQAFAEGDEDVVGDDNESKYLISITFRLELLRCTSESCREMGSFHELPRLCFTGFYEDLTDYQHPLALLQPVPGHADVVVALWHKLVLAKFTDGSWTTSQVNLTISRDLESIEDKSRITAWGWDATEETFERDFSSLSTQDPPASTSQPQAALCSLIVCRASGLIWRIIFPGHQNAGSMDAFKHWEAQAYFLPQTSPVRFCIGFSSSATLLITNGGDACLVTIPKLDASESDGSAIPLVPEQPSALSCCSPMSDFAVADLQGLGHNQVYAACGTGLQGSLQILHAGAVLEELQTTGGTLTDVTEEVGVEDAAQTLVAGPMGPLHLLQALVGRLILCRLHDFLLGSPHAPGHQRRPSKSQRQLGESTSSGSAPGSAEDQPHPSPSAGDSPGVSSMPTGPLPEDPWQEGAGVEDVWRPPANNIIGAAAVCDDAALVSCAPSCALIALQMQGHWGARASSPGKRKRSPGGVGLVQVAQATVKQEVSCLAIAADTGASAQEQRSWLCLVGNHSPDLQLWRLLPIAPGISSHDPVLSLQLLASLDVGRTSPLCAALPDPLLGLDEVLTPSEHVPESVMLLPSEPCDGGCVQALVGLRSSLLLHIQFPRQQPALPLDRRKGMAVNHASSTPGPLTEQSRSGIATCTLDAVSAPHQHSSTSHSRSETHAESSASILSRQRLGTTMPLVLVPLPVACGFGALALTDRAMLLRMAPEGGAVEAQPLAAAHIACAAPWWQDEDPSLAEHAEGQVPGRALLLDVPSEVPLSNPLRPHETVDGMIADQIDEDRLLAAAAVHASSPQAPNTWTAVQPFERLSHAAMQQSDPDHPRNVRHDDIRCIDPETWEESDRHQLQPGEAATCIAVDPNAVERDRLASPSATPSASEYDDPSGMRELNRGISIGSGLVGLAGSEMDAEPEHPLDPSEYPALHHRAFSDFKRSSMDAGRRVSFDMRPGSFDHIPPAPSRDDLLLGSVNSVRDYHRDPSMSSIGAHYMPREKVSFMAVGTRVGSFEDDRAMEEERPMGRWGGRLLLFVLTSPGRTMQGSHVNLGQARQGGAVMQCADQKMFQSGVHALCWLSDHTLLVSAGERLITYCILQADGSASGPKLQKMRHASSSRAATSLQATPSRGLVAAGDALQGVWVYRMNAALALQVVYAQIQGSNVADCVPLEQNGLFQATLAVEASGWLTMAGPCARTPERNIETVAAFKLGSPGTRILSGMLAQETSRLSNQGKASALR